jgi:LysR family glycine cleavage system transcriptional activator
MSLDWRDIPSLTALRAFEATAREGNFADAARALNVTHAAVSQQVRGLEQDLGVSLATRQGRQVVLTNAGQKLARTLTAAFTSIGEEVAQTREGARSRGLRVTCSPFIAERIIMPNLKAFWDQHPGAEISLSPTRAYVDVTGDGYDLGIRSRHPDVQDDSIGSNLSAYHLKRVEGVGIVAPSLITKHGAEPEDLPWLWHEGMDLKLRLMRSGGLAIDRLKRISIGSPNLLLEAVRGGIGATLFTMTLAQEEIAAGRVVRIELPRPIVVDYIAVLPKAPLHPLAEPFAEWVKTLL